MMVHDQNGRELWISHAHGFSKSQAQVQGAPPSIVVDLPVSSVVVVVEVEVEQQQQPQKSNRRCRIPDFQSGP